MGRGFLRAAACLAVLGLWACSDDTGPQPDGPKKADGGRDFKTEQPPPSDARIDFYVVPDVGPVPDGVTCKLAVESINKKPVFAISQLSSLDDLDKATPGIQLDVVVSVIGRPDGTPVTLQVTGLQPSPVSNSAAGKASFTGITLAPGLPGVTIRPEAAGCVGTASIFSVQLDPSCSFVSPTNGAKLTAVNDKIPGNGTFDYDVSIQTQNATGATVTLFVAGTAVGTPKSPDLSGLVLFPGEALSTGPSVELKATVSAGFLQTECTITISVDNSKPLCDLGFNPPAKLTSKGVPALGPAQDAEPATPKLQTTVTVDTSAGVDQVILDLDGVTQTATPDTVTHKATFKLTLDEGTRSVQATCKNSTASVEAQSPKTSVLVDTTPPPAVTDLACTVTNHRAGEITCTWKSVDDGATGSGVEKYQVRYRTNSAVSAANFDATDTTKPADQPAVPAGSTQTFKLTGLKMPNTYAEAVKAVDYVGNVSTVSNLPAGQKVDFKVQEIVSANVGDAFGFPLAVGDFNCDGYADIAVGMNNANGTKGEVQLFFSSGGSLQGPLPPAFSKKISGTIAGGYFGIRLAALNFDNDPDKCTDLAVRAFGQDGNRGRVYMYLGRKVWSDREDETADKGAEVVFKLAASAPATERLGFAIAGCDINGDGTPDLAMSHWDEAGAMWSTVIVSYGKSGIPMMGVGVSPQIRFMPATADLVVAGGSRSEKFAYSLERGGLLNGDAFEELLVGAQDTLVAGQKVGGAYVLLGATASTGQETVPVATSQRVIRLDGGTSNVGFGAVIGGVGDLNGDGSAEFVVTDFNKAIGSHAQAGEAYVFDLVSNPKSVANAKAVVTNDLTATAVPNFFARSIAVGANFHLSKGVDINADGFADLVFGMARTGTQSVGSAQVFLGKTGALSNLKTSQPNYSFAPTTGGTTSYSISILPGDLNGDGYSDVVISETIYASSTGRVFVYY